MDTDVRTITDRLGHIFDCPTTFNASRMELEFEIPGWSFDAFTRTGKLGLWGACRLFEVARVLAKRYMDDVFSSVIQLEDGSTVLPMVRAQCTRFSRRLYQYASMARPMMGTLGIGQIGRTSFTLVVHVFSKDKRQELGVIERLVVYKNISTNKLQPVPQKFDDFRKLINPPDATIRSPFRVHLDTRNAVPYRRTYNFMLKACASDMDLLYHVSQSVYYRYCLDAVYEAAKNNFLTNFSLDICEYEVQSAQGKHTGECFAGDWINVYIWEDEAINEKLHFEIEKDDLCVFLANITFYNMHNSHL